MLWSPWEDVLLHWPTRKIKIPRRRLNVVLCCEVKPKPVPSFLLEKITTPCPDGYPGYQSCVLFHTSSCTNHNHNAKDHCLKPIPYASYHPSPTPVIIAVITTITAVAQYAHSQQQACSPRHPPSSCPRPPWRRRRPREGPGPSARRGQSPARPAPSGAAWPSVCRRRRAGPARRRPRPPG